MGNSIFAVNQDSVESISGNLCQGKANKMAFQIVTDFYTQMSIENRIWQLRAGTVTTPLAADIVITDTACDHAIDPATGYIIMPVFEQVAIAVGTGATINTIVAHSVAGASSVGAAFVPLNLNIGGPACNATARVAAAGGVTVPAELATTARTHFVWACPAAVAATPGIVEWVPRCPPVIGAGNVYYVQLAATGAGFTYYAHTDFIELPLTAVS